MAFWYTTVDATHIWKIEVLESTICLNAKYNFPTRWEKFLHIVPLKEVFILISTSYWPWLYFLIKRKVFSLFSRVKSQGYTSQSPWVCSTVINVSPGNVCRSLHCQSPILSSRDKWTGPALHHPLKERHLQSTIESFSRNSRKDSCNNEDRTRNWAAHFSH